MDMSIRCRSIGSKNFNKSFKTGCRPGKKVCFEEFARRSSWMKISSRNSRALWRTSKRPGNDFRLTSNGKHAGHTAPDQIDPQHRADYEGDADGRGFENAPRATARSRRAAVCRVDEQSARFAAKAD